jgi:hypothetical protein
VTKFAFPRGTPFHERLVARLVVPALGPCLEWQGAHHPQGYGEFREDYKLVRAHVRAFELANGPVPPGLLVCHRCDNPPCCEPTHLYAGTYADNARDAALAGSMSRGVGEAHAACKFTDAQVAAMRSMRNRGALLQQIADTFGAETSYVSRLCRREVRP